MAAPGSDESRTAGFLQLTEFTLTAFCRELEVHSDQRVGLTVGNRRVLGEDELG